MTTPVEPAGEEGAPARSTERKPLHFLDVLLFCLGSGIGLRWVAVAAAAGPASVSMWMSALLLFYIPQVLAVAVLCSRYSGEGGIYLWVRQTLGEFPAFLCGWIYWSSNIPYIPGVLYFTASTLAYAASPAGATSPPLLFGLTAALFAPIVILNLIGLNCGKWFTNVGGISMWIVVVLLIGAAGLCLLAQGSATRFPASSFVPGRTLDSLLLWSTMVFALAGAEGVAFLRSEVKGGAPTLVRALTSAGIAILLGYVVCTLALLVMLPTQEASALTGLPAAIARSFEKAGWQSLTTLTIVLLALTGLGLANSWYVASARLPFAAGLDHYLPQAFARRHPRWGTPVFALLLQAVLVLLFLILSQTGATARQAYDFLIRMSVLGNTLPYAFLFLALLKRSPVPQGSWRPPGKRRTEFAAGVVGLASTVAATVGTLLPAEPGAAALPGFLKIAATGLILVLSGIPLYWWACRRARLAAERGRDEALGLARS